MTRFSVFALWCLPLVAGLLVACSSSTTAQNRIIISDPNSEDPPVIQIRPATGQVYSINPQATPDSGEPTGQSAPASGQAPAEQPTPPAAANNIPAEAAPMENRRTTAARTSSTPAPRQISYNQVKTDYPVVALTFDDGPHPELTPKLLDHLKKRNVRATFYLIGRNVTAYPEIVRRMVDEGHEIGNHTYSHPALSKMSASRVKSELDRTTAAIREAAGVTPATMRPPYGATNTALNRRIKEEFGMPVIMWSVDPQDWRYRNASRVSSHIISNAKSGDIILAHDIHASTIAAMPAVLDALLGKGFQFLTVSELLDKEGVFQKPTEKPAELVQNAEPEAEVIRP
jgi:peptidoglycan/xylan/chitin deacetylase (PgdA/CDA1 family)